MRKLTSKVINLADARFRRAREKLKRNLNDHRGKHWSELPSELAISSFIELAVSFRTAVIGPEKIDLDAESTSLPYDPEALEEIFRSMPEGAYHPISLEELEKLFAKFPEADTGKA